MTFGDITDEYIHYTTHTRHVCVCGCEFFYKIYEFGIEKSKKCEELYVVVVCRVLFFSQFTNVLFSEENFRTLPNEKEKHGT